MAAIEFQAHIKNGVIEVPAEYRDQLTESVRVIILTHSSTRSSGMIEHLLKHPIQDSAFVPLKRDEMYQDRT